MRLRREFINIALLPALMISATSFTGGTLRPQAAKKIYQRTGAEGAIGGTVSFGGRRPAERRIDTSADPACTMKNPNLHTEWVAGNRGRLANVFVYIKSGAPLEDLSFETPATPAVIDQVGCRFVPHVLGMQTNQMIEIPNSDPTTHNVHPNPMTNIEWNQSHVSGAPPIRKQFTHSEVMIPIKCNQHPWMKAYVGVLPHPFFAVSDENGMFRIEGLPAGSYTLAAWHETLGEKTIDVVIGSYSQQDVTFRFNASEK